MIIYILQGMRFEWDVRKNEANIRKHGFGFERAKTIFDYPVLMQEDDRKPYSEKRFTRIISARLANKKERRVYETMA